MFDLIFFAIPAAVTGYAATLFVLMKFMGEELHDVSDTLAAEGILASQETQQKAAPLNTAAATPNTPEEAWGHFNQTLDVGLEHIPTDSMLKRHYLTHLHTLAVSLHSQPEEATLRRHHAQLIDRLVEEMCQNPEMIEAFTNEILERSRSQLKASPSSNSIIRNRVLCFFLRTPCFDVTPSS